MNYILMLHNGNVIEGTFEEDELIDGDEAPAILVMINEKHYDFTRHAAPVGYRVQMKEKGTVAVYREVSAAFI